MPSSDAPGLRPLTPVQVTPRDYPGECKCTWSFNSTARMWSLKYVYSACFYKPPEGKPHYMLADEIAMASGRGTVRAA